MSRIRSALALVALGLAAVAGHAQTSPAVSTIVAFSLSNPVGNLVQGADGALYGVGSPATSITGGVIYRAIRESVRSHYDWLMSSGLYDELVAACLERGRSATREVLEVRRTDGRGAHLGVAVSPAIRPAARPRA